MAANVKWIPPLPPGWEAKYDPTQRRYFYINHSTRSTSWEDPRYLQRQPVPQPQAQAAGNYAQQRQQLFKQGQQLQQQFQAQGQHSQQQIRQSQSGIPAAPAAPSAVSLPQKREGSDDDDEWESDEDINYVDERSVASLKKMYPTADEALIRRSLEANLGVMAFSQQDIESAGHTKGGLSYEQKQALTKKIKREYPNAHLPLIEETLSACQFDAEQTGKRLTEMGYKPESIRVTPIPSATSWVIPMSGSSSTSPSRSVARTASPARASPARSAASAAAEPSNADKQRLISKFAHDYPDCSALVVEMVLETVKYDESRARDLLKTMEPATGSVKKTSTTTTPSKYTPKKSSVTSPSAVVIRTTPEPMSVSPVLMSEMQKDGIISKLRNEFPDQSMTVVKATLEVCNYDEEKGRMLIKRTFVKATTSGSSVTNMTSPHKTVVKVSTPTSSTSSRTETPTSRSKASTSSKQRKTTPTAAPRTKSKAHAMRSPPKSAYRTMNNGPNPALTKGHDKSLLLTDYIQAQGANPQLRKGPNHSCVRGSQGAMGPDKSLQCGPKVLREQNTQSVKSLFISEV